MNSLYFTSLIVFSTLCSSGMAEAKGGGRGACLLLHPRIWQISYSLSQPESADYAHHISTRHPRFSDLPPALQLCYYSHSYSFSIICSLNLDIRVRVKPFFSSKEKTMGVTFWLNMPYLYLLLI